jgi:hypothetical protein
MNVTLKVCPHGEYLPIMETELDKHTEANVFFADTHIDDVRYIVFVSVTEDEGAWDKLADELNRKGYFTRKVKFDGVPGLEICKPDCDIFSHDIAMELRNPNLTCTQIMSHAHWYVRVSERQKARW